MGGLWLLSRCYFKCWCYGIQETVALKNYSLNTRIYQGIFINIIKNIILILQLSYGSTTVDNTMSNVDAKKLTS